MAAYEGNDGGAGGKFRKRPFRRSHTTPYDRPTTALRLTQNLNNNNNNGWLSRIVDPASKLITAGAHKIFSSFRKRLLPPPPSPPPQQPPDEREEIEDVQPEAATPVVAFGNKGPATGVGHNASRTSDSNGVAELEDILKQKTFTRSEIDHLTSLLLSRTVEKSGGANKGRSEPKFSDLLVVDAHREKPSNPPDHETRIDLGLPEAISTPAGRTKVSQDVVSSPAEIAKAYMGSKPVRLSSSALGLQNQSLKEDLHSPCDPSSKQISPALSLIRKPSSNLGVSSNGFMTPKFRGRSAIYSMARTPYSRAHSVMAIRAGETTSNVSGGSSSYSNVTENNQSERRVLKRRSSVLENDIGSVGPIRRIRQKPNLLHPKILSVPPPGGRLAVNVPGVHSDVEVPSSVEWRSQNHSSSQISAPSCSGGYVPSQSIETAHKILEQLDKFTPKGKSPVKKSDVAVGNTPTKTSPGVLDGSTREDTRTIGSVKALQSTQDSIKINGSFDTVSGPSHLLNTSSRVEDVSMKKLVPSDNLARQNGLERRNVVSHVTNKSKATDYMLPVSGGELPQTKRAFQISALEDCPELDDDVPANGGFSSTPLTEWKEYDAPPKSVAIPAIIPGDQLVVAEKSSPVQKEPKSPENCSAAVATTASFTSSVVPLSSPDTKRTMQEVGPQNEANNTTSTFSFKSDKLSSFSVPTSAAPLASAAQDTKHETPNSANDAAAISNGPDQIDSKSTQGLGDTLLKSGDFSSVMSSTKGPLSTGLQTNNAAPSSGLQTNGTVPATDHSSAPAPVSSPLFLGGPTLTNGSAGSTQISAANVGTSVVTSVTGSITALPASTIHLSSTMPTTFSFRTSELPSTSAALAGTVDTPGTKLNDTGFGNSTSIFGVNPFASASGGNGISGFSASTLKAPGGDAKTAGSAGRGVAFGFQTSSTSVSELAPTSSLAASSVSPPTSTSSPSFLSDSTPSILKNTSGFSSSVSGPTNQFNLFSSTSAALGSSSATSSIPTSSVSSIVFGWNSSAPTTLGSTPALTSASSGFSFGLGSSGSSAAATNSPIFGAFTSSSSSSSQTFIFGTSQGSAASASSTLAPAVSTPASTLFQSSPFANASSQTSVFGSNPSTNSGQMTMEDSMAEDFVQPSTPAVPPFGAPVSAPSAVSAFGAPVSAPSSGFSFNSSAPAAANPFTSFTPTAGNPFTTPTPAGGSSFQFNGQPNPFTPSNTPFQPSGSLEFNGGAPNSFSLGTNDGDKSNRRFVKAKRRGAGRR